MDNINLIRTRHIESLIIPSHGDILCTYLGSQSLNTEYRILNTAVPVRNPPAGGRRRELRILPALRFSEGNTDGENTKEKSIPTKQRINPARHRYAQALVGGEVTKQRNIPRSLGFLLLVISLGGIIGPLIPALRLEAGYMIDQMKTSVVQNMDPSPTLPPSAPTIFDPLVKPDGEKIEPISTDFSVIVPKVGINAPVTADVDPKSEASYLPALAKGVAHASTSFLPDQDGTVYLFSHSTNYDWFVKDLNAVFYHLKSLDSGDLVVVVYKNTRYTYKLREKKVVAPSEISYLIPQHGTKTLILQTCWPPGSTAERLLIFADLVETQSL